jgi:GT2 family glycosyltransferase
MKAVIDLAVVIVNYNVRDLLRACLRSVYESQGNLEFQVCVVDNNSEDDSVAMVRKEFPQARIIANEENVGYPSANNQGLHILSVDSDNPSDRPRFCLLLNPDTEVPADAFSFLVAYLDANPEVAVVGPKLVMLDGNLDLACRRAFPSPKISAYRMMGLSRLFPNSPRFGRYNMTYLPEDQIAEVDSVVGAFMMVRVEAVSQVGLMDERFWMYGEDLDWAKRMKDVGWKVVYNPEVTVLHVKRASSRHSQRAQIEFYRAMLIFYYKHYHQGTSVLLHWLILLGIVIKGGRPIMGDVLSGPSILQE